MNSSIQGIHLPIQGLRKVLGTVEILCGINFEVTPGEFIAIVGQITYDKSLTATTDLEGPLIF